MPRTIIVFTQPDSLPCEAVKRFLKHRGAKFENTKQEELRQMALAYAERRAMGHKQQGRQNQQSEGAAALGEYQRIDRT